MLDSRSKYREFSVLDTLSTHGLSCTPNTLRVESTALGSTLPQLPWNERERRYTGVEEQLRESSTVTPELVGLPAVSHRLSRHHIRVIT